VLQSLKRNPHDSISAVRLGQWLKANRNKVVENYRFESFTDRNKVHQWRVAPV